MDVVFFDGNKVFKDVKVVWCKWSPFFGDHFSTNTTAFVLRWPTYNLHTSMYNNLDIYMQFIWESFYLELGDNWVVNAAVAEIACPAASNISAVRAGMGRCISLSPASPDQHIQLSFCTANWWIHPWIETRFIWVFLLLWWAGCSSWLPSVQTIVYPKLSASKVGQMDFPNVC